MSIRFERIRCDGFDMYNETDECPCYCFWIAIDGATWTMGRVINKD